jgi:hypothetical protein
MDRNWPTSDTLDNWFARANRSDGSADIDAPGKEHHVLSSPRMDATDFWFADVESIALRLCFARSNRWYFQPWLSDWRPAKSQSLELTLYESYHLSKAFLISRLDSHCARVSIRPTLDEQQGRFLHVVGTILSCTTAGQFSAIVAG